MVAFPTAEESPFLGIKKAFCPRDLVDFCMIARRLLRGCRLWKSSIWPPFRTWPALRIIAISGSRHAPRPIFNLPQSAAPTCATIPIGPFPIALSRPDRWLSEWRLLPETPPKRQAARPARSESCKSGSHCFGFATMVFRTASVRQDDLCGRHHGICCLRLQEISACCIAR
jgi:hypothetical protein